MKLFISVQCFEIFEHLFPDLLEALRELTLSHPSLIKVEEKDSANKMPLLMALSRLTLTILCLLSCKAQERNEFCPVMFVFIGKLSLSTLRRVPN